VRSDGTVPLPFVPPVKVEGLTAEQAQDEVRKAYTVTTKILAPERARILVTVMRRRQYHILVIRQDSPGQVSTTTPTASTRSIGFTLGGPGIGSLPANRGTGFAVDLPAYENDVLTALALTGGLPGFDAVNEIIIQRGYFTSEQDRDLLLQQLEA